MSLHASRYDRLNGILSPQARGSKVLVIGLGAGSGAALSFQRSGCTVCGADKDPVITVENLARTVYTEQDVGGAKAVALARHMKEIDGSAEPVMVHADICTLTDLEVKALLDGVDLIFAGTDELTAQARANEWSESHDIPAVFISIHEKGRGGIVHWTIPGQTACFRCVARKRFEAAAAGLTVDLHGAAGCLIDAAMIDSVALKIALAILDRGTDSEYGRLFAAMQGRNEVIVRTHPDYRFDGGLDVFDAVLSDLPTSPRPYKKELQELAYLCCDTLWLAVEADPDCPVCGGHRGSAQ